MKKKLFDYQVGDKLFFVPSDHREKPYETTIVAKGRKYLTLERNVRVQVREVEDHVLGLSGEYPQGYVYANKEDWIFVEKWKDITINLRYKENLSDDQKARIIAIIEESNEPHTPLSRK